MLRQILIGSLLFATVSSPAIASVSPTIVAQAESRKCTEDDRFIVCHAYRDGRLVYVSYYDKKTGEVKITWVSARSETIVDTGEDCPPGTDAVLDDDKGVKCIDNDAKLQAFTPAPGCEVTGQQPGKDGNPTPIVTCGELIGAAIEPPPDSPRPKTTVSGGGNAAVPFDSTFDPDPDPGHPGNSGGTSPR